MADTNSDLIAAKAAALLGLADGIVNGDDDGGLVLRKKAIVTLPAGVADADTFQICDLPPGAVLDPTQSSVTCSADPGTTLVLDVGHADNVDEYADGITLSAGGQIAFTSGTMPSAVATTRRTSTTERVFATVPSSGASSVTADVKLIFTIVYVVKG